MNSCVDLGVITLGVKKWNCLDLELAVQSKYTTVFVMPFSELGIVVVGGATDHHKSL